MDNLKANIKKIDYPLLIAVLALSTIGNFLVASATASFANGRNQVIIQLAATGLGLILCLILALYDYEFIATKFWYIVGINIFLLVLVLIIGKGEQEVGGKSWIRIGPIGIQPAELVKIGFIISFAYQLDKFKDKINDIKVVLGCLLHISVIVFLIMRQPDFGTMMVFVAVFAVMLFMAKISWKYIVAAFFAISASLPVIWIFFFSNYQKKRIINFLDPSRDTNVSGYQVMQSKTAIGGGKAFGQGLFNGILTQNEFLPAKHTDFIFSVAGEELGFVGATLIVALIIFIVIRCFLIALHSRDNLGSFIAIGIGTMILVQSFENIGMTIGITPVTGITLPFLSYGGSSMVTNFIAIGLVLNVRVKNKRINFV